MSRPGEVRSPPDDEDALMKRDQENVMKRDGKNNQNLPLHDYREALQTAVSWLGERYLLAEPAPRRETPKEYFSAPRQWHVGTGAGIEQASRASLKLRTH